ncbi:hypothetical protein UFOVP1309_74 [uncultured Caudovirales phage]|uniref:PD-(D/E)XK nuclease superfamily n=1 Tax=uncultured Caudovirales phage TaxID=2100421 RepID=A0A6J5RVL0_9CAUD|nr:hypothetical protein UFOVP1309_74 [uncultured Caudovirales phage]
MNDIQTLIDKHHEDTREGPRGHMGCSQLGHACDRWLWLSFRFAVIEKFPGRILRLFRRGQLEERTVVSDLQAIGMKITSTGANQSRVDFGCHISGSTDGIIENGVPGNIKAKHILEIKTASAKSFKDMQTKGLEKSKPVYWVQVHLYMMGKDINHALFIMVNKDNDEVYSEIVNRDDAVAIKFLERGKRIVKADNAPAGISTDASWYECKYCAGHDLCHGSKLTKEVNCRTCAHSTAVDDGTWHCAHWDMTIPDLSAQLAGCDNHILHPDLTPGWQLDRTETGVIWMTKEGPIHNAPEAYLSREIVANWQACASGVKDDFKEFDARVVG